MTLEEFYKQYANEPLLNRKISLDALGHTLYGIDKALRENENLKLRLLIQAEKGFESLKAAKDKTNK